MEFAGVVLAGGTAARLGGADKAGLAIGGETLLTRALAALDRATQVVVVGPEHPTDLPVRFTREVPAYGGPVAGLFAGLDALTGTPVRVVVLAVDMPHVTSATIARLVAAAADRDGAVLVDGAGRRQLAAVLDAGRLRQVRPGETHGRSVRSLWALLDLVDVVAAGEEARDVDTWPDLTS